MPEISVILPAYNAEATLQTAVESILHPDAPELEVIIVDDGSTDRTAQVCHALSTQHPNLHVIHQKNAGICAARNRGLSIASGRYIAFCDDDDVFLPGGLALLWQTAEQAEADLVRGGYELLRQAADGSYHTQPHFAGERCTLGAGQGSEYGIFLTNSGPQFVWNALYRRAAIRNLRFNERCRSGLEDFVFNASAYRCIGTAVYLPQPVYRHYEGRQSTSCSRTVQAMTDRIRALEPWMQAEYHAALYRCDRQSFPAVWQDRRAQAVTFLMHQLRDAQAPAALRRYAWSTLRKILSGYPGGPLDILLNAGHNKKKTLALLLYQMRLQRVYDLLPAKEEFL